MKTLLEDYQRRLATINEILDSFEKKGTTISTQKTYDRLEVKASCYREFIAELEREIHKTFGRIQK